MYSEILKLRNFSHDIEGDIKERDEKVKEAREVKGYKFRELEFKVHHYG